MPGIIVCECPSCRLEKSERDVERLRDALRDLIEEAKYYPSEPDVFGSRLTHAIEIAERELDR